MKFFEETKEKNSSQETQKASLGIITPADEKTHGFIRVDDSPQIFYYL